MLFFLFVSIYLDLRPQRSFSADPLFSNEHNVEDLIGEYHGFYLIADKEKNGLPHSICSMEFDGGNVTLLLPESFDETNVILDFYTIWDAYLCTYSCNFKEHNFYSVDGKTITCVKSEMPFAFVDVDKDDFNKVNASFTPDTQIKQKAAMTFTLFDPDMNDLPEVFPGEIKPRGAASWNLYQTRSYAIKLSKKTDLLGIGEYKKWNLIANATDKTCLKNFVFYRAANNLGLDYSPKCVPILLFINNSFHGVYFLCTKVDAFCKDTLSMDDYLINWESPNAKNIIYFDCSYTTDDESGMSQPFVDLVWPEPEYATRYTNAKVQTIVQNYVDTMESGGDLSSVIDLESYAKYYWIQEFTMNIDAWYRSCYAYYLNSDQKLHAGPIWDLDCTLGATNIPRGDIDFTVPTGWKVRYYGFYVPLFKNEQFVEAVNDAYYKYDVQAVMEQAYFEMEQTSKQILDEGELHYKLLEFEPNWSDFEYVHGTSYEYYTTEKLKFFRQRLDWIEQEMAR